MSGESPRPPMTYMDIHPYTHNLWDTYVRVIRDRGVSELLAIKGYVKDKSKELSFFHRKSLSDKPHSDDSSSGDLPRTVGHLKIVNSEDGQHWVQSYRTYDPEQESGSLLSNVLFTTHCLHVIDTILERYCIYGELNNWDGTPADVRSKVERSELAPGWLCTRAQRQQLFERLRRLGFGEIDSEGDQFIWSGSNYAAELGFLADCLVRRGLIPDISENERTHGAEFLRANFKRPDGHMDLQSLKNQWRTRTVDSIDTDLKRCSAKRRYRQIAAAVANPEAS